MIFLNMYQVGGNEEIPGFQYIHKHMEQVLETLKPTVPLQVPPEDVKTFVHCFNNLVISFIGALV